MPEERGRTRPHAFSCTVPVRRKRRCYGVTFPAPYRVHCPVRRAGTCYLVSTNSSCDHNTGTAAAAPPVLSNLLQPFVFGVDHAALRVLVAVAH